MALRNNRTSRPLGSEFRKSPSVLTVIHYFSQTLQADSEIIPHCRPRPLSCTLNSLFAIHLFVLVSPPVYLFTLGVEGYCFT